MKVEKFDLKKEFGGLYNPSKKDFSIVDVPTMNFLMIDGHGNPNISQDYQQAMEALYSMAYTLKFSLKQLGHEYVVPPLEGLWWMPDMNEFTEANKDHWDWTMMIAQPDFVTADEVEQARMEVAKKKDVPALAKLRFEPYPEGLSVLDLYFGAYSDEGPTIARMHQYIKDNGYATNGKHHEVYLGDPRRNAPEKLKTIIRQRIKPITK